MSGPLSDGLCSQDIAISPDGIFIVYISFIFMDRCSIPIREVSILWSYIDILLLEFAIVKED